MFKKTNNLKSKRKLFLTLVSMVVMLGVFSFVYAAIVSDDFSTTANINDSWRADLDTASGEIKISNQTCDYDNWFCAEATTCANDLGDGDYIVVAKSDAPSTKQWKTSNTSCDQPQCGQDGGQDGDNLVADNTVDFNLYPAQEYCQSIGGRLPTLTELQCIYTNKASFGSFATSNYWSATEFGSFSARSVYFSNGNASSYYKTVSNYVRCVRGW